MHNDSNTRIQGKKGELLVADYLTTQGYTVLAQNYSKRFGEIDLIAYKQTIMVFVEVKARQKSGYCSSELVTLRKQEKIIRVAREYITHTGAHAYAYRFDIALIDNLDTAPSLTYIENAFYGSEW